jgi:MerR family transcriptional regulator, copper efflux regulator
VGEAGERTGWSARMLRYLESVGLVVPRRTPAGYRLYGEPALRQLNELRELRTRFGLELDEIAFAARLRRDPELRTALETWMGTAGPGADWVDWDQRKHERLLVA